MHVSSGRVWATGISCSHPSLPAIRFWAHGQSLPSALRIPGQLTSAAQPATAGGGPRGQRRGRNNGRVLGDHGGRARLQTWHGLGPAAKAFANCKDPSPPTQCSFSKAGATRSTAGVGQARVLPDGGGQTLWLLPNSVLTEVFMLEINIFQLSDPIRVEHWELFIVWGSERRRLG